MVVRAECLEQADSWVHIQFSVRDSGIGISSEQQANLFKAFSQADTSTTRRYGGTGLGLSISQHLVKMMEGQLWVESEQGKGSTFYFDARLGVGLEATHKPIVLDEDLQGLRALVVENNLLSQEVMQETLQAFALAVTVVCSGEQALVALRQANSKNDPFALVFINYRLPEMDGLETASAIQKETELFDTLSTLSPPVTIPKILLMTAFTGDEIQKRVEKSGLDGFIEKPFSRLLLFDTIQEIFGKEVPTSFRNQNQSDVAQQVRKTIAGARILLVDDIDLNRQVARELLEGMGFLIELASDGQEAVNKVEQSGPFDAILMDLQMPKMDGYNATRTIRQNPAHAQLPIIATTAHAMDGIWEKCQAATMNAHVAKPIDLVALCKTLLRWIPPRTQDEASGDTVLPQTVLQQQEVQEDRIPPIPATLPGLDVSSALQRMNNDFQFFQEMLRTFNRDFSDDAKKIRTALESQEEEDRILARRLAHSMKGVAGNLSADPLFQAARNLENGILEKKREAWPLLLDTFEEALDQVTQSIQTLVTEDEAHTEQSETSEEHPLDDEKINDQIRELYEIIQKGHSEAEEVFASLKPFLQEDAVQQDVKQLEACLNQYDFDEALEPLMAIAKIRNIPME